MKCLHGHMVASKRLGRKLNGSRFAWPDESEVMCFAGEGLSVG